MPKESNAYSEFYSKAWDPANFQVSAIDPAKQGTKEKCKLFVYEHGTHSQLI